MDRRPSNALSLLLLLLLLGACEKKTSKPLRTEPWLAHPPDSAAAPSGLASARYSIDAPSQIHFELPSKRGPLRGTFLRVTGELTATLGDLAQSRGHIDVDLRSLTLDRGAAGERAEWLEHAERALGVEDAGGASASFELASLEDVKPQSLEPGLEEDGGPATMRRVRGNAVGNLLLHGFRVVRKAPLEAEFSFDGPRRAPSRVVIRARAPFVISLETHAIEAASPRGSARAPSALAREARVSVELYGTKID